MGASTQIVRTVRGLFSGRISRREVGGPILFTGDAVPALQRMLVRVLGGHARFAPPGHRVPSAATVAELGRDALRRGESVDPATLVPIYVRPSEAELARERRQHAGHLH